MTGWSWRSVFLCLHWHHGRPRRSPTSLTFPKRFRSASRRDPHVDPVHSLAGSSQPPPFCTWAQVVSPPRGATGLDEVSRQLGELAAYIHEHRHGVNNLNMKFDALSLDLAKRVEGLDIKIAGQISELGGTLSRRIEVIEDRLDDLESVNDERRGTVGTLQWLLTNAPNLLMLLGVVYLVLKATGKLP